jgi:type IV pilus assembly protein PilE
MLGAQRAQQGKDVKKNSTRIGGFSLVELMIAVAIMAILATIAYPSYQDHLRKGRRAAAQAFLLETASRQQQYLLDARAYAVGAAAIADLSLSIPADVTRFYTVTIDPAAPTMPPTYVVRALPIAGSGQEPDGELTLDQAGHKTRAGQPVW